MKDSERIQQVLDYLDITANAFSRRIGYKSQTFYNILNGQRPVARKLAKTICDMYPEINEGWLLTGQGEMLNQPESAGKFISGNQSNYERNAKLVKEIKHIAFKENRDEAEVVKDLGIETKTYEDLKEGSVMNVSRFEEGIAEYKTKCNKFVPELTEDSNAKYLEIIQSQQRAIAQLSEASLMNAETMKNLFNKLNEK